MEKLEARFKTYSKSKALKSQALAQAGNIMTV